MSEKYEYDNEYDFGEDDELNPTYKRDCILEAPPKLKLKLSPIWKLGLKLKL